MLRGDPWSSEMALSLVPEELSAQENRTEETMENHCWENHTHPRKVHVSLAEDTNALFATLFRGSHEVDIHQANVALYGTLMTTFPEESCLNPSKERPKVYAHHDWRT